MSARLNLDNPYPLRTWAKLLVRLRTAEVLQAPGLPVIDVEELDVEVISEARYLPLPA